MRLSVDRNRLYLVCFYFSMSFFYLSFVLEDRDPIPMLGYILALIIFIVISHDSLLQVIIQSTGQSNTKSELDYFSAFIELNQKIHKFLEVDDVLVLVNDTLKEKIQINKVVYLLSPELKGGFDQSDNTDGLKLEAWPESTNLSFHNKQFEAEVDNRHEIMSIVEAGPSVKVAFEETNTSLLVPIVQNDKILCVILIGRLANQKPYTEFEYQMFGFMANQLSIILDRIRIYSKVIKQTAMEHAEKVQVMQSLSANIAHEMRTPLSGIRASISGLEEYLPGFIEGYDSLAQQDEARFPSIREDVLQRLTATPKRIQLMIDQANTVIDMLLMNLRESSLDGDLFNDIDAAEMVEQAIDRYPFKKGEREKLILDTEKNFTFSGIESLCIYILFNLLKNAFYSLQSAQKGEISIKLDRSGEKNLIIFKDTGLGIDPKIADKIFDGFFTTKHDGTGAGLAFCRRTIRDFHGEITCRSVLGEFAEFRIVLPAKR